MAREKSHHKSSAQLNGGGALSIRNLSLEIGDPKKKKAIEGIVELGVVIFKKKLSKVI